MDEKKVKLRVLGVTYNQIQSGAYALILAEEGGKFRIPVVIGAAEAQSIAAKLENVQLPRPLIHDVFHTMTHAFWIVVKEVFIYKFQRGVFYSEITFSDGERDVRIDSRTSDAIAIALRTKTPIYTTSEILQNTGFSVTGDDTIVADETVSVPEGMETVPLTRFAIPELEKMLQSSIVKEEYERAAEIKKVIDEKKAQNAEK